MTPVVADPFLSRSAGDPDASGSRHAVPFETGGGSQMHVTLTSHSYGGFKVRIQPGDFFSVWVQGYKFDVDVAVLIDVLRARFRDAQMTTTILESRLHELWRGERPTVITRVLDHERVDAAPEMLPPVRGKGAQDATSRVLDRQEQARRRQARAARNKSTRPGRAR